MEDYSLFKSIQKNQTTKTRVVGGLIIYAPHNEVSGSDNQKALRRAKKMLILIDEKDKINMVDPDSIIRVTEAYIEEYFLDGLIVELVTGSTIKVPAKTVTKLLAEIKAEKAKKAAASTTTTTTTTDTSTPTSAELGNMFSALINKLDLLEAAIRNGFQYIGNAIRHR